MLDRAIKLALEAHEGQLDWNGKPFILHPIRVMQAVSRFGEETMIAAVLHDSVEDSNGIVTLERLKAEGIPSESVGCIDVLTHSPSVSYETYVGRVSLYKMATRVKLADLADNIDPRRLLVRNDHEKEVLVRHAKALQELREIAEQSNWT